jgi:hypothetical protein
MKKLLSSFLGIVLVITAGFSGNVLAGDFKIGVLAKNGAAKAMAKWGPLGAYLSETVSGDSFTIVPLDFDEVMPSISTTKGELSPDTLIEKMPKCAIYWIKERAGFLLINFSLLQRKTKT